MIEDNINLENRYVQKPPSKENPIGEIFRVHSVQKFWVILEPIYHKRDKLVDHCSLVEFKRSYELLHPEEKAKVEKLKDIFEEFLHLNSQ
jgi:hypothetical protein